MQQKTHKFTLSMIPIGLVTDNCQQIAEMSAECLTDLVRHCTNSTGDIGFELKIPVPDIQTTTADKNMQENSVQLTTLS